MLPIRTILHPTDFSEHSQQALAMACSLAQDFGAQLFLVNLVDVTPYTDGTLSGSGLPHEETAPAPLSAANHKVRILRLVDAADPATQILKVARSVHANLIVLGADGDSGRNGPLVGNVAEQILRETTFPLLIVKTQSSEVLKTSEV